MTMINTKDAINRVLATELARDKSTIYLGETIRDAGATGASKGLFEHFGEAQVVECPVSENGFFGAALGLALSGFRPIVEIYSADFALIVANEIINDFSKWRQQQARPGALPITVRGWMGRTRGLGPEHSQCMEAYFHHAPGLTIVVPGTPSEMAGLLRSAIRSNEPVLFLEHRELYEQIGDVPDDLDYMVPLGKGTVVKQGTDVTLVAWGHFRNLALAAAETVASEVSVEVVDPRTIKPMDFDLILSSVQKTGKLVVAEESPITGNVGAEIVARTLETANRPITATRVAMPDMIHPYSASMEVGIIPDHDDIAAALRRIKRGDRLFPAFVPRWERKVS
jgi:pyruvate/2-oxoglutarate/acetoin dehydrogenase E1 component